MKLSAKLVLPIVLLQLVYGLAVFALTRAYYTHNPAPAQASPSEGVAATGVLGALQPFQPAPDARLAEASGNLDRLIGLGDEYFEQKRYAQAVAVYAQALALAPDDVEMYNEIGISLHYSGRSAEAIEKLKQGTAIDPRHQRIWLSLGFVQSNTGNIAEGKAALQRAIDLDPKSAIGLEAKRLMDQMK